MRIPSSHPSGAFVGVIGLLEHLMLGLSVGSLSQRFALDLNFSEPSAQYNICLSAELHAKRAAA